MTFESGSCDAAFVAEATRKYGAFKKEREEKGRPARRKRKASQTIPGGVSFSSHDVIAQIRHRLP